MNHPLTLFFLFISLTACSEKKANQVIKFQGSTMGTQYHITIIPHNNRAAFPLVTIKSKVTTILSTINRQMSTYIPDSEISKFNQHKSTDWFSVSKDVSFVIRNAQKVSKASNGTFDITIAPLIDLWGFGAKVVNTMPSRVEIDEHMKYIGYKHLDVRQTPSAIRKNNKHLRIDLSAIAKGFAVDKISIYLSDQGFKNHLVEIGGEIRSSGKNQKNKLWNIAIENPSLKQNKKRQSLEMRNQALATSGNYQNYFLKNGVRYSHTLNPKTGLPITHKLASATVVHSSAMLADAYATAIMVMGEVEGKKFAQAQNLKVNLIYKDKDLFKTWGNIH